jgi:hypothetical protein
MLAIMLINQGRGAAFIAAFVAFFVFIHLALLASIVAFYQQGMITLRDCKLGHTLAMIDGIGAIIVLGYLGCYYTAFVVLLLLITLKIHGAILRREKEESNAA